MPFLTEFDFVKLFAKNVFNFRKSTIIDFWQVNLEKNLQHNWKVTKISILQNARAGFSLIKKNWVQQFRKFQKTMIQGY